MPIEIKELNIRIHVNEGAQKGSASAPVSSSKIIEECIEQMVEVLKQQKER